MNQILESNLPQIKDLCIKYEVLSLKAFGSVLNDLFNDDSDIDLLVIFNRNQNTNAFDQYFDFKLALEKLLDRSVDLVCENSLRNPYFKEEVQKTNRILYAA